MPNAASPRPQGEKPRRILFTGGGSAGHVSVNLALIPLLQSQGWNAMYMGSSDGIEKQLIGRLDDVAYYGISTGKLRRYVDLQNVKDPFRVVKGVYQAYRLIRKLRPDVVFSKGGFVSVPVVLGAWLNRVPVIIHESDLTPGLANRIANPFARKVCVTFGETASVIKGGKAVHIGPVVRSELLRGNALQGLQWSKLLPGKPVLLIMGGSLGAKSINGAVRRNLPRLTQTYQIIHLCGKGELDESCSGVKGYRQYEYVHDELPDLVACAEIVISRAGSNSIFEFLAMRKPMLLVPLSRNASRGDQILNAESFRKAGFCEVLQEEELTDEAFLAALGRLYADREAIRARMREHGGGASAADAIAVLIRENSLR
ncbi:undecaprenyldiphospho-muramoylpentapeptide beta-N-acetylglucosaminyltransferase [Paenibacillus lycopersici]|uniref:UDP-N-acetylglucosamine--N-acetylmuramyl-(pentapeptide) pyrophosphoryl-undecaprenol N-acetylglucosamine transferase n=1 Tax=Paenibacillus lycopersici TaxID=2704462 RepID=A0A6C0G4T5_9BACL|nr:undecaprenyldiphospho-muramoylpentapeptide beta-N-acetylglucosaminyltransferase [Paenibacillus lycopersici]QHT62951.1 undecaprenyldiphospho-muramoylpentapeptide beta-N-acetylglucosaminyltransferase [Paenibacillus lycopersici]